MLDITPDLIRFLLLAVIGMILSCAVHEWAHAITAVKLGDDTPRRQGRLTLNPMAHIDPIGTVLMPAIGALMGFIFGYARPVEFIPSRLTRRFTIRTGVLLVAIAGPLSNLVLAFLCGGLLKLIPTLTHPSIYMESDIAHTFGALLFTGIWLNIVLCLFNFLPVYPLDGSKILEGVLPLRYHGALEWMQRNAMLMMILVFLVGARLLSGPMGALLGVVLSVFRLTNIEIIPFFEYLR
jgi:Zn-dependent protease